MSKHLMIVLSAVFFFALAVSADDGVSELRVAYPNVIEDTNGQVVEVYFTPYNSENNPVSIADGSLGSLNLAGVDFQGQIQSPTTDLYLVIILDTSGSMSPNAQLMEDAAIQALRNV